MFDYNDVMYNLLENKSKINIYNNAIIYLESVMKFKNSKLKQLNKVGVLSFFCHYLTVKGNCYKRIIERLFIDILELIYFNFNYYSYE